MPDDAERDPGPGWLIEPPSPGEVHIQIAVGEGIAVSDEMRQALDQLLRSLMAQEDVDGYYNTCLPKCLAHNECNVHSCSPLNNCNVLKRVPCAMHIYCEIASVRRTT